MTKNQNIDDALSKLQTTLRKNPLTNGINVPSHIKDQKDIQRILEILAATDDINTQIKIFVFLSAWSSCDDKNLILTIKFHGLYDKINSILNKGLSRNAVHALNLLYTLLNIEIEGNSSTRRKVVQYLKEKVRASGCLAVMVNKFNSVMDTDTWNALCQCIAAACNNCTTNQTYCSLLIPVCIQKCSSKNKLVFLVLQNLLRNHTANMQLFIESNGFTIFTMELLQYEKCMQLLKAVVVQYSDVPQLLVRQTTVLNILRDFVRVYGCGSEIGHKAAIILHHIESRATDLNLQNDSNKPANGTPANAVQTEENKVNRKTRANVNMDDTDTLMENIDREISNFNLNQGKGKAAIPKASNPILQNMFKSDTDEYQTKELVQRKTSDVLTEQNRKDLQSNVAQQSSVHRQNQHRIRSQRKIITRKSTPTCKKSHRRHQPKDRKNSIDASFSFLKTDKLQTKSRPPSVDPSFSFLENAILEKDNHHQKFQFNNTKSRKPKSNNTLEPSFSFLENLNNQKQCFTNQEPMETEPEKIIEPFYKKTRNGSKNKQQGRQSIEPSFSFLEHQNYEPANEKSDTKTDMNITRKENMANLSKSNSKSSSPGSFFNPVFSSTLVDERIKRKDSEIPTQSIPKRRRVEKSISREPEDDGNKSLQKLNTSLSTTLFNAINDSCTSLVKSVTSIFRKKKTDIPKESTPQKENTISFSFLNYVNKQETRNKKMQRMRNKCYRDNSLYDTGSCDTCDDTIELKKKLRTDENLRQTVKKLKMGINLFGCDFKKISRTMWPQDSNMKPEVLYKLYRKLLIK